MAGGVFPAAESINIGQPVLRQMCYPAMSEVSPWMFGYDFK